MQQVNVFIETSSRFRGNVERKCGYVLSTQLRTGKKTREHFGRVTGTYHQAILLTMVDALDHMTRTCDVCFYISDLYVTSRLGKITEMAGSGWLDTKGKPIANREEWRRLFKAINQLPDPHKISAKTEKHSYSAYLTTRKGLRLTTRSGKYILVQSGGAHIRKRFSISKAPDGKVGLSYDLHSSTLAVRKQKDGKTLIPASVTFSATQNDNGLVRSYSGRYSIQETEDGTTYTLKYTSADDEIQKIYTPSNMNVKAVRCTLLSAGGVSELDTQTVIILADAEGLTDDIKKAQGTADQAKEAIVVTNQNVANIETSMEGFRTELSETTTDLHGLTDNTLLYNVKYHDNNDGTTTLNAVVYKNGTDVTKTYPDRWFTWSRKTESGENYIGYGYSITVNNSGYEFGGVCVGTFATYDTLNLTTRSGKQLTTRSGNHITIWKEK